MICQRCLQRATKRSAPSFLAKSTQSSPLLSSAGRSFSQTLRYRAAAESAQTETPPSAGSDGAAIPPATVGDKAATKTTPLSSVPAGTVLKGLNFLKNKTDPVALEDAEYPAWLWKVLEKKEDSAKKDAVEGDLFAKSKKQRQRAAKALRRQAAQNPDSLVPKIPLYEQSIDLPRGDGTIDGAKDAAGKRKELTQSMRNMRRNKIKEANFLKGMN
ncbi:Hypothetical protein R9X50_00077300 [Acrodontium crateriforme]|uniref:Large ribosomal subunit protein mL54 n=1 Tax=Acrodontium crateriforme TaxID=150365 RepID=A0AAQ3R7A8_9PEZI|nr:Hypothetical protein R9X50_00077300 [Acrodontium crateriforme]